MKGSKDQKKIKGSGSKVITGRSEDQIQRIRGDNQNKRIKIDKRGIFRDQCGARVHDKITDMTQKKANQRRVVK